MDGGTKRIGRISRVADFGDVEVDGAEVEPVGDLRRLDPGRGLRRRFDGLAAAPALAGGLLRLGEEMLHQVLDVDHADGIVERVVIDDEAGVAGILEGLHEDRQRRILLHGHDVGAWLGEVVHPAFAQIEDVAQHRALFRREAGGGRRILLENIFEILPCGGAGPQTQAGQQPVDPAVVPVGGSFGSGPCGVRRLSALGAWR